MTLDDAIAILYAREINCGCETFWDGGIKVWIGDTMNDHHETTFSRENMRQAGQWLVEEATRLYPKAFSSSRGRERSPGRQLGTNFSPAVLARKQLRGFPDIKLAFAAARQNLGVTGLPQSLDRGKDGIAHSLLFDLVVGPH